MISKIEALKKLFAIRDLVIGNEYQDEELADIDAVIRFVVEAGEEQSTTAPSVTPVPYPVPYPVIYPVQPYVYPYPYIWTKDTTTTISWSGTTTT